MTEVVVAGSNSRAVAAASENDIDAIKIAQSIPRGLHEYTHHRYTKLCRGERYRVGLSFFPRTFTRGTCTN